jgi:hypothetical protein
VPQHAVSRVALVVRGDRSLRTTIEPERTRLAPIFAALTEAGIVAVPSVFGEDMVDDVRADLDGVDGVLVWVDPVTGGDDRSVLDELLREVARRGAWVSAHPDVILRMGTKQVLYDTRDLGWGSDVDVYRSVGEMRERLPPRLGAGSARVLKQYRGNGGIGVWKVERLPARDVDEHGQLVVRVQGARHRDESVEELTLDRLIERSAEYFEYADGAGRLVDQPFQPRISDGICRCYLVRREVVGFCRQLPAEGADPARVFGLPSAKTMYPPDEPRFATLRARMEHEWVPAMQAIVGVDDDELPLLWDADFLFGDPPSDGSERFVLCEINVSAVTPFPPEAPPKIADAVRRHPS